MDRYELLARWSVRGFKSEANFFRMLEAFDHGDGATQKYWHDNKVAKQEKTRYNDFRASTVQPALTYWRQRRYQCVVSFIRRALDVYQRIKQSAGGLDFTDLLLITAKGLREQPYLRAYFQQQVTHLLVDEFQDTDPVQAELVILLSSTDCQVREWANCRLRPGGLFVVGDPKQSIYRFRRGDIVTYNRVKSIFVDSGGEVLSLTENFRSSAELLEWNNEVFATKFPAKANDVAPAHTAMDCGRPRSVRGTLSGIYRLPVDGKNREATTNEAEQIALYIKHAIATGQTIERWSAAKGSYELTPVQANDFLIITRVRQRIDIYKRALEKQGVACEVSGSNSFRGHPQLLILLDVLRTADDPYNPVPYLSLLRERLYGFSDAELYELKRVGGSFLFTAPIPEELESTLRERFATCARQLSNYQAWLRRLPPVVALQNIADDLGLLAESAVSDDGMIALGSLLKAFEVLRAQSLDFDNTSDLIAGIEQLLEVDEAESVSALGGADHAVRIMNLHKAKGLEAPIVFLVDTAKPPAHPPRVHIDRDQAEARGAMCIAIQPHRERKNYWKYLAEPVSWPEQQAREQTFLDAEEVRLLYVATTRAANMLVVSVGSDDSAWAPLHAFLNDAPQLLIPTADPLATDRTIGSRVTDQPLDGSTSWNPTVAWQKALHPTYGLVSVKQEALHGSRRPDWQTAEAYGMVWGVALHELLDIASKQANVNLHPHALNIAQEYEIQADRVTELVATVQAVLDSDIWQRWCAASRRYSELPFDVPGTRDGLPVIIRGVIDLIFEESDGWVIVDYKSDSLNVDDVDSLCAYYRPQLQEYAHYWQTLTGHKVKEIGLYLTRLMIYVPVDL